jgi:hypothetical protein
LGLGALGLCGVLVLFVVEVLDVDVVPVWVVLRFAALCERDLWRWLEEVLVVELLVAVVVLAGLLTAALVGLAADEDELLPPQPTAVHASTTAATTPTEYLCIYPPSTKPAFEQQDPTTPRSAQS